MSEDAEVSAKAFFNSVWFRGIARVVALVLLPAAGWLAAEHFRLGDQINTLNDRVDVNEARLRTVDTAIISMSSSVGATQKDVAAIKSDIAGINGKLSVILRSDEASIGGPIVPVVETR